MATERCPYCGRFMAYENSGEWGENWVCAHWRAHALADPSSWSIDVLELGPDAVDIDGDPISGIVSASLLSPDQLHIALGLSADVEIRRQS